ncbi:hypothetical protein [Mycobacterium sp.]
MCTSLPGPASTPHLKGSLEYRGQPRTNIFHHPEELLRDDSDDDIP